VCCTMDRLREREREREFAPVSVIQKGYSSFISLIEEMYKQTESPKQSSMGYVALTYSAVVEKMAITKS
jgi:hypothetical protein